LDPLDVSEVARVFKKDGLLNRAHPAHEHRPEQNRMVEAVRDAFNNDRILLVEAGTGVGKSLAYLVPSILWARLNKEKVVVSTNTKNLQEQLYQKDIPLLRDTLDTDFDAAIIKGRGNYLCVRKFLYLLREFERELSPEERTAILPMVVWFPETDTGDLAENTGFLAGRSAELRPRVTTRTDECVGPKCRYWRSCFVRLARARALRSDLIIANHAVVFSEMGLENVVLPAHRRIVFDEAHNVENVATEHLARKASPLRVLPVLGRLNRPRRDGTGSGLLASLRFQIGRAGDALKPATAEGLSQQIEPVVRTMETVSHRVEDFSSTVGRLFDNPRDGRIRYTAKTVPPGWDQVRAASEALGESLADLIRKVGGLERSMESIGGDIPESQNLVAEMATASMNLEDFAADLAFCIAADEEEYVYWAEYDAFRGTDHGLHAAPLDIRSVMEANVYDKMRTVLFSSATLTVDGRFDFMRSRLGLDGLTPARLTEIDVGTSFDFPKQSLLGVVNFLSEPRDTDSFTRGFCETVIDVLRATKGRSLVLFTSHRMLRESQPVIKQALEPEGILVLAQGIDGERSQLARIFQENVSSVLLGTQSFWEGVDIVGEALSCLILAKLPFQVHTDPIVEARCELIESQGGNAFYEYTIPTAVIRLKQGFGRLIRTRADRGVVIIADRRVVTRNYGRPFLRSLPAPARTFRDVEELIGGVRGFLGS